MRDYLPSVVGLCVGDSAAVLTLLPSLGLRTLEEKVALPDSSLSKSKSRYTEREIVNQKVNSFLGKELLSLTNKNNLLC